jgi:hypothetical protein
MAMKALTWMLPILAVAWSAEAAAQQFEKYFGDPGGYEYVAPLTGCYRIYADGARGGRSRTQGLSGVSGGRGAYVWGDAQLNQNESLKVFVGGAGRTGPDSFGQFFPGGGGGGASYVARSADPLLVAGGGGGAGANPYGEGGNGETGEAGGNSGGTDGMGGRGSYGAGGGGWFKSGGKGQPYTAPGGARVPALGGELLSGFSPLGGSGYAEGGFGGGGGGGKAGGGGGGYGGGGGGSALSSLGFLGGGGGGSYVSPQLRNVQQGIASYSDFSAGNGYVRIKLDRPTC